MTGGHRTHDVQVKVKTGQKRRKEPTTRAAKRMAEIADLDDQWSQRRAAEIAALPRNPPNIQQPQPEDDPPEMVLEEFLPRPNSPLNHADRAIPLPNFAAYEADPVTRTKRAREEQKWKAVYPKMFPAFMRCRALTLSWGDQTKWDSDWKSPCTCAKPVSRHVDLVDLLSKYLHSCPLPFLCG